MQLHYSEAEGFTTGRAKDRYPVRQPEWNAFVLDVTRRVERLAKDPKREVSRNQGAKLGDKRLGCTLDSHRHWYVNVMPGESVSSEFVARRIARDLKMRPFDVLAPLPSTLEYPCSVVVTDSIVFRGIRDDYHLGSEAFPCGVVRFDWMGARRKKEVAMP